MKNIKSHNIIIMIKIFRIVNKPPLFRNNDKFIALMFYSKIKKTWCTHGFCARVRLINRSEKQFKAIHAIWTGGRYIQVERQVIMKTWITAYYWQVFVIVYRSGLYIEVYHIEIQWIIKEFWNYCESQSFIDKFLLLVYGGGISIYYL